MINAQARKLLELPDFLCKVAAAVRKSGLVGEVRNCLVLYVVATSRLLDRPNNLLVKGQSSAGKNFLADRTLSLFPEESVFGLTGNSLKAFNYLGDQLQHKVVYIKERTDAAGSVHPTRLLISEGELSYEVALGRGKTKTYRTKGPIACISTTTEDQITIDDETRHLSIWVDESKEQTARIMRASFRQSAGLSDEELRVWRTVQHLLQERVDEIQIEIPADYLFLAEEVKTDVVRVRRYFGAFLEACKTVCLIRSFQRMPHGTSDKLLVDFSDVAITQILFDKVVSESLSRSSEEDRETQLIVRRLSRQKGGKAVEAADLMKSLGLSKDQAYDRLRKAEQAGAIRRANKPTKDNRKFYLPSNFRFLSSPRDLFKKLPNGPRKVRFMNPLTGEWCEFFRD